MGASIIYHKILGIDLAKSVFQLCLLNDNHIIFKVLSH